MLKTTGKHIIIGSLAVMTLLGTSCAKKNKAKEAEETHVVEAEDVSYAFASSDSVSWIGTAVSKEHRGKAPISEGNLLAQGDSITGGKIMIDLTHITCDDLSGKKAESLVGHLKNADFFETNTYQTAQFDFTSVVKNEEENKYSHTATGNLTIKGITKSITFGADLTFEENSIKLVANPTFNRTDWGIKYKSAKFFENLGDKLINDEIGISFSVTANK